MQHSTLHLTKRIIIYAKPFWGQLTGLFFLSLLATPLELLKPIPLTILIDSGFGHRALPSLITYFFDSGHIFTFPQVTFISACLVIIIAVVSNIYVLINWLASTFTGEKLVLSFRSILFNHIQRLSLAYHDKEGTSDSLYRIQYDTMSIRTFLIDNFSSLLSSFITLIAMTVVMFYINWRFALIALCVIPPLGILLRISSNKLRRGWKMVKESESRAMSVVHEALNSLRVVKAFGQEQGEEKKFYSQADEAVKGEVKMAWTGAVFNFIVGLVFSIGSALFIYYGALLVNAGKMTLGELTLVIAYLTQIFGPLEKISKNINAIQSSLTSIDRVFTVLDRDKEVKEADHPIHVTTINGSFEFVKVNFQYDAERPTLNNISFKINPGDRVGIMGTTGAGKSTLINLLTRFYDPSSGYIYVDGTDIRKIKLDDYRKQFGIVLQDPVLFSTSIEENIAYGKPFSGKKEIIEAARLANADEFIMRSKDGYATLVGQRGMQLSGGERQRISLARAFIKNAPVLIMDEPTSSLDVKTESQIMEAMERLMAGRTTFLITHRIDTLKTCNVILHLELGKLVEIVSNENPDIFEQKKKELISAFYKHN